MNNQRGMKMTHPENVALNIKRQFTAGITRAMKRQKMTQSELARRMGTSRAVVHRMLRTDNVSLTLATITRALIAVKSTVRIRTA